MSDFTPIPGASDLLRFWVKVDRSGPKGCWLWTASVSGGYGQFRLHGKKVWAHRVSWSLSKGPIPNGMHLDHLCRVTSCVNPDHLDLVTRGENILRGIGFSAINARKTHCPRGHVYQGENLYIERDGSRKCRTCVLAKNRRAYRARMEAVA